MGFFVGQNQGPRLWALHFAMKTIITISKAIASIAMAFFVIINLGKKTSGLKEAGVK
jgi:hypothetical protein